MRSLNLDGGKQELSNLKANDLSQLDLINKRCNGADKAPYPNLNTKTNSILGSKTLVFR